MIDNELKNIVEALVLSSNEPVTLEKIQETFDEWQRPTLEDLQTIIESLKVDYSSRALELIQVAGGFKVQTKSKYATWVARLQIEKPAKYSRALLETLAIIAYKQPVTRADIEDIRGVAVNSQIIKTLMEREWIRIAGYKDVAGKPAVYTTTKEFLNYFNLNYLSELPPLPEIMDTLTLHEATQPIKECTQNEQ
ncbi:TPA: SMC-Scp complex subunit ScpB [Legionella pneumophila]|uniref:Segregation and condensation protein B n=1 Tax=Legionella pneumophila subsp. pneumophila TaxID=91891 RepID=A0AAV2UWZ6_LEGPN|nr:SMC-Scp complex subunit ScpB [Legionella pneumophila]MCK1849190.1 SMC-Scp complex subunit ScpB [Legionella pneumophila]MCZ4806972.1 SMC-Scp complex subunit ScpB [Legionella pneumophila]MDI9850970.1 SMC-Scp complex subunit ScpB [Legionella pneumophila]MDW8854214.1 SMC-Scp complex subunit ScpB [Legionella pneumophila]MDW8866786.1 SMC-Scp complex subunit ScpB [Legionella pneumophila]